MFGLGLLFTEAVERITGINEIFVHKLPQSSHHKNMVLC